MKKKNLNQAIELFDSSRFNKLSSFINKYPNLKIELNDYFKAQTKALEKNKNDRAEKFLNNLNKDFLSKHELADYIQTLEIFCFEELDLNDRKQAYAAAIFANNKRSVTANNFPKKTENIYRDMVKLTRGYIAQGNPVKDACKKAGFKSYEVYKLYNKKFNKK